MLNHFAPQQLHVGFQHIGFLFTQRFQPFGQLHLLFAGHRLHHFLKARVEVCSSSVTLCIKGDLINFFTKSMNMYSPKLTLLNSVYVLLVDIFIESNIKFANCLSQMIFQLTNLYWTPLEQGRSWRDGCGSIESRTNCQGKHLPVHFSWR
jgi:hypothetical protein